MNPQPPMQSSSNGPVIGIIIVIIVLLVGAFYFLGQFTSNNDVAPVDEGVATTSTSDEVSDIEADLEAENFDDIDAELQAL